MADAKQEKNKGQAKDSSSEGFGFKQSPLGFDKNEVNLYINKLKKQMKEQEIEFETKLNTVQRELETAKKDVNEALTAKRAAEQGGAAPAPAASAEPSADTQKIIEELKAENDKKIMELRKQVLDERRNVAKLDKECATAQMSEKKVRAEYDKLKEKYLNLKKSGSGGTPVTTSNADEVFAEASAYANEIIEAAKAYAKETVEAVNTYKADVEKQLAEKNAKLSETKTKLDAELVKFEAIGGEGAYKEIAEKMASLTTLFDEFTGKFDSVNDQIGKVTAQIDTVTGQFGAITKQFNDTAKQFNDASAQIDGFSKTLEETKADITEITKTVADTKDGIGSVKTNVESAKELAESQQPVTVDVTGVSAIGNELTDLGTITAELKLPEFDESKFNTSKLDEIKAKLKVETTFESNGEVDDDDEDLDLDINIGAGDILSSLEIEMQPDMDTDMSSGMDDGMSGMDDISSDLLISAEPEEAPAPAGAKRKEEKAELDSDFEDFFISKEDDMNATPLVNTKGVGAIDDFNLDQAPEDFGDDFDLAPNDLTAAPEKGADLGDDIYDMAINPVDGDDNTLSDMMAEAKRAEMEGDFELTPANIEMDSSPKSGASSADDFGEFADLFAAGSAETAKTTNNSKKKEKPSFRQPTSNSDDDLWNFGGDSTTDDSDLSADSDLSDLLL